MTLKCGMEFSLEPPRWILFSCGKCRNGMDLSPLGEDYAYRGGCCVTSLQLRLYFQASWHKILQCWLQAGTVNPQVLRSTYSVLGPTGCWAVQWRIGKGREAEGLRDGLDTTRAWHSWGLTTGQMRGWKEAVGETLKGAWISRYRHTMECHGQYFDKMAKICGSPSSLPSLYSPVICTVPKPVST